MSSNEVQQVVIVNAPKVADFEDRLNRTLAGIPAEQVVGIDYLFDPETYGAVAIIRYRIAVEE
jgi:hypothetical protein